MDKPVAQAKADNLIALIVQHQVLIDKPSPTDKGAEAIAAFIAKLRADLTKMYIDQSTS